MSERYLKVNYYLNKTKKIIINFQAISKEGIKRLEKELKNAMKCPKFDKTQEKGAEDAEMGMYDNI